MKRPLLLNIYLTFFFSAVSFLYAEETITIKAVGDLVFPQGEIKENIFKDVSPYLGADFLIGNLEGPITDNALSTKNPNRRTTFAFKFSPRTVPPMLKQAGFNVLNIGNNHTYDYGVKGFEDTKSNLAKSSINYVGLRNQTIYAEKGGTTLAFIGFGYSPRFNDLHGVKESVRQVREAKTRASIVVVLLHAGAEGINAQNLEDREEIFLGERRGNVVQFARAMVDSGARCVVGFGPHVLRAIEFYNGGLIAYSLGNFVPAGGLKTSGKLGLSAILELVLSVNDGSLQRSSIIPVNFNAKKLPQYDQTKESIAFIRELTGRYYEKYRNGTMNISIDVEGTITTQLPE